MNKYPILKLFNYIKFKTQNLKEFRLPYNYKIFICIVTVAVVCFFYFVFKMLLEKPKEIDWNIFYIVLGVFVYLSILLTIELLNTFKGRFIIGQDRITAIRYFSKKQLLFKDIQGFKIRQYYIFFESNEVKNRIKISVFFQNYKEILDWASSNFNNLDIVGVVDKRKNTSG